ncbi:RNA-binding protein rsd1 [Daldinia childiae]|uniref:RNA-binding protein rsd1 n=1 Tax=Daldinia childiae TaxID=326645 RepID=UPI00144505AD|nr:RNA-binding protein rsd1 [Daldinia childiae]KAF3070873.1 RNA-binding protein rsd1 [Daldinia childiae]
MATLDVEALLDATASNKNDTKETGPKDSDDRVKSDRNERRDRDRSPGRRRDRSNDRVRRDRGDEREATPRSDAGSHKSRRRSRSRDDDRRHSRRHRGGDGDYYRSGGRGRDRTRSRSPRRHYRPRDDHRDRDRERDERGNFRGRDEDRPRGGRTPKRDPTPQLTEDERDRRTVFVQQLAARLRTKELKEFFEKVGPVNEAQIVKDRISGRSKGVGYVEFKNEESVTAALQLTGHQLLGIPVIVQLTEAEKNRQVRTTEGSGSHANSIPFHRLYVGIFTLVLPNKTCKTSSNPSASSNLSSFKKMIQVVAVVMDLFREADQAREALEKMNGFDLAGRPIRVGLGNDKFTPESTANILQRFQGQNQPYQGSAFSGAGGRGPQASGFDRAGGRDNDKATGASALDDTDVAGVNFNNYSRDALMRKLARTDDASNGSRDERQILKPKTETKPLPMNVNMASRCVVLHNMFDPAEEEGESWIKELEDDVRQEAEEKYGHVVHISLDPNSPGDIFLKFDKVQGGENAIKGLNGRYFGGRMISAAPVVDAVYSSLFSRTKAI